VRSFGAERAGSLPADTLGGGQLKIIGEVVETLNGAITAQTFGKSSVQQVASSRTGAREALRESMQAISRTARMMALAIDPATLAAWEHARHVERPARQPKRNNGGTNTPRPAHRGTKAKASALAKNYSAKGGRFSVRLSL
jgi:hypothetical protein